MTGPSQIRTLGFLFIDLRGYTKFLEAHGDAAGAQLVRDYRAIVRERIERFGGSQVMTEGDSFFVTFDSGRAEKANDGPFRPVVIGPSSGQRGGIEPPQHKGG